MIQALLHVLHNKSKDPSYNGLPEDPSDLYMELMRQRAKIDKYKRRMTISQTQYEMFFPPGENKTNSAEFDFTTIVTLIRVTELLPTFPKTCPSDDDHSISAYVRRAMNWRNLLMHTNVGEIDFNFFEEKRKEGTKIVSGLYKKYLEKR